MIAPASYAEEEVILDIDAGLEVSDDNVEEDTNINKSDLTFQEKILNIKHYESFDTNQIHYLLDEITTIRPKSGFIESIHPLFGYRGNLNINIQNDDTDVTQEYSMIDVGFDG